MIKFQWQHEFIECNLISLLMIESILKEEKKKNAHANESAKRPCWYSQKFKIG